MNDGKENEAEHTLERGVTRATPICQTNWKSIQYSVNMYD